MSNWSVHIAASKGIRLEARICCIGESTHKCKENCNIKHYGHKLIGRIFSAAAAAAAMHCDPPSSHARVASMERRRHFTQKASSLISFAINVCMYDGPLLHKSLTNDCCCTRYSYSLSDCTTLSSLFLKSLIAAV